MSLLRQLRLHPRPLDQTIRTVGSASSDRSFDVNSHTDDCVVDTDEAID